MDLVGVPSSDFEGSVCLPHSSRLSAQFVDAVAGTQMNAQMGHLCCDGRTGLNSSAPVSAKPSLRSVCHHVFTYVLTKHDDIVDMYFQRFANDKYASKCFPTTQQHHTCVNVDFGLDTLSIIYFSCVMLFHASWSAQELYLYSRCKYR